MIKEFWELHKNEIKPDPDDGVVYRVAMPIMMLVNFALTVLMWLIFLPLIGLERLERRVRTNRRLKKEVGTLEDLKREMEEDPIARQLHDIYWRR